MKKLCEFDSIHTPQDWIDEALNVNKNGKLIHFDRNKSHRFSNRIMKSVVAAALVIIMVGAGTITYFAGSIKDYTMTDAEKKINQQPFLLMLSGTDDENQVVSKNGRSDANLLVAVNPKTKKIAVVCTQRDAYVDIPAYTENGKEFPGGYDKLTHSSNAGMEVLKATIEKLYGVPVDYYSKVNFNGITNIVDALGGISVYSDKNFTTDTDASPQEYTFTEGYNDCDGAKTLAFCRERHVFANGDEQRTKNETNVVEAILNKMMRADQIYKMDDVLDAISQMMLTDMTKDTMIALLKGQINSRADWSYTTYTTSGTSASKDGEVYKLKNMSVFILNQSSVQEATSILKKVLEE